MSSADGGHPWSDEEWSAREEWGWFVGLYEGEGCTIVYPSQVVISINSTDQDVLERAHALVGGALYGPYRNGAHKPYWTLRIHRQADALSLLKALKPSLSERRQEQVQAGIDWLEERNAIRLGHRDDRTEAVG